MCRFGAGGVNSTLAIATKRADESQKSSSSRISCSAETNLFRYAKPVSCRVFCIAPTGVWLERFP